MRKQNGGFSAVALPEAQASWLWFGIASPKAKGKGLISSLLCFWSWWDIEEEEPTVRSSGH